MRLWVVVEGSPAEEEGVVEFLGGRRRWYKLSRGREERSAIRFRRLPGFGLLYSSDERDPTFSVGRGLTSCRDVKNPSMANTATPFKVGNIRAMEGGKI
jgi:hypothetical protein